MMNREKTKLLVTGFGLGFMLSGVLAPALAGEKPGGQVLKKTRIVATAPLAVPRGGVMECTIANLHNKPVKVRIRQLQHFRFNPPLPNAPFVVEKVELLGPGQSTALGATVGMDPAINRCTFEFVGRNPGFGRRRSSSKTYQATRVRVSFIAYTTGAPSRRWRRDSLRLPVSASRSSLELPACFAYPVCFAYKAGVVLK